MTTLAKVIGALCLLACGAVGAQGGPHRIGFLITPGAASAQAAVLAGMRDLGYEQGRNLWVETIQTEPDPAVVERAVEQFLRMQVKLIVSLGALAPLAHAAIRGRLPMVFTFSGDPVQAGLVQSLARPALALLGLVEQFFDVGLQGY